mgnify:CR=1 FL=1
MSVHLCGAQLRLYDSHLTRHSVIHVHLLSTPDQILRHDLGGSVLIFLRESLDLFKSLSFLVLQLSTLAFDLSDGTSDDSLVLLRGFFRINFWLTVSHDYYNDFLLYFKNYL